MKRQLGFESCPAPQLLSCDLSVQDLPSAKVFADSLYPQLRLCQHPVISVKAESTSTTTFERHFFKPVCVFLCHQQCQRHFLSRLVTTSIRFHGKRGEKTVVLFVNLNVEALINIFTAIF